MAATEVGLKAVRPDSAAAGRFAARRRLLNLALRVLIVGGPPVALTAWFLTITGHAFAFDFQSAFWPAGKHVLAGQSPFPPATHVALANGTAFVYPAPAALLMAPFALLPVHAAAIVFTTMLTACALLALSVAGVRDWRCYFAIFLWVPVLSELQTANLTLLLALGAALVWRYRDRRLLAGVAAGVAIALKLFLWPLVVWLLATRRYGAGFRAVVVTAVVTFSAWAAIGFAGLADYVPTLRLLANLEAPASYTPFGVGRQLGLTPGPARAIAIAIGAAAIGLVFYFARKRADDKRSFALALVACLLCSPVVWLHYFTLLIVALAVLRPVYGPLWVLPLLAVGPSRTHEAGWWMLLVGAVFAVVMTGALAPAPRGLRRLLPRTTAG